MSRLVVALSLVFAASVACSSADGAGPPAETAGPDGATGSGASGSTGGEGSGASQSGSGSGGGASGGASAGGGATGWGAEHCPADANVGTEVGQQLPEIVLKDCDGNDVSLDSLCGASALWIFAAHGWCPLCQSVSSNAESIHDGFAGQNVASVNVIVVDGQSQPATADYCKLWRDAHGHEDVITLYDPSSSILSLWRGSSSLSAFVSSERTIVSKLVHDSDTDHIVEGIEGALNAD